MIYITSDIHGAFDIHKINPDEFTAGRSLTKDDYLIICGDFGCVWDGGSSDRFFLNWLESLPWTTLFIDGNHENFDLLEQLETVDLLNGKAGKVRSNIYHLKRGEIYEIEGKSWLCIGGGFSHDTSFRTPHVSWWEQELISEAEAQKTREALARRNWQVDYILSHEVYAAHPMANTYPLSMERYPKNRLHQQQFLEEVRKNTDYKAWFCGHYHKDHYSQADGRPCFLLFDTVEKPDVLLADPESLKKPEKPKRTEQKTASRKSEAA